MISSLENLECIDGSATMASQITAKDRGDEQSSRETDVQPDDEAVEAMLKHKAAILERFARCNGLCPRSRWNTWSDQVPRWSRTPLG